MENFAKHQGFDPLICSNWYNVVQSEFLQFQVSNAIKTTNNKE